MSPSEFPSSPSGTRGGEKTSKLRSRLRSSVTELAKDHVCDICCGSFGRPCCADAFCAPLEPSGEPDPEPKTPADPQEPPPKPAAPTAPEAQRPQLLPKIDGKSTEVSADGAPSPHGAVSSPRAAASSPRAAAPPPREPGAPALLPESKEQVRFEPTPPPRAHAARTVDVPKKKRVDGISRMVARLSLSAEKYGVVKRSGPSVAPRVKPLAPQPPRKSNAVLAKQMPAFRRIAPVEPTPLWAPTKGLKSVADLLRAAKDENAPRVYGYRDLQKSDPGPGMPLALVANAWADRCDDEGRIQGRPLVVAVAYGVEPQESTPLALAPALGAFGARAFAGESPVLLDAELDVAESAEVVFSFAGVGAAPSPCATHICYVLPDGSCFCVVRNLVVPVQKGAAPPAAGPGPPRAEAAPPA